MQIDNVDEIEKFIKEMNYFFTYIERTNSELKSKLTIKNLEQEDLLHEIELSKLNAFELIRVAKRLKTVRKERRDIKNKLEFITTVKRLTDKYNNKMITGDIVKTLKDIKELKESWNTRIYSTRVLEDLKISQMKKDKQVETTEKNEN